MKTDQPRPLHRLTPLRTDPLVAWLSGAELRRLRIYAVLAWFIFVEGLFALWLVLVLGLFEARIYDIQGPIFGVLFLGFLLFNPVRRAILRERSTRAAEIVRLKVPSAAVAVDDWGELEKLPDGSIVSLVGWARGRAHLAQQVSGQECIGLAVACQQRYPGVMETLHDFEIVDEAGLGISVRAEGARMVGKPNTNIGGGTNQLLLVASLGLPAGAVLSSWDAFAIRDGDPLMVVGFKRTVVDPDMFGIRQVPSRPELASEPSRPLLIFPIDAERFGPSRT